MNKNELITGIPVEVKNSATQDVPVHHETPDDIEMFHLPTLHETTHEIGKSAVAVVIDRVPGVSDSEAVIPGTPVKGSREKVVIGDLDDWKGGNPNRIVGFKDR
jgi:hypothetical protein